MSRAGTSVAPVASWFGLSGLGDAGAAAVFALLLGQVFVHMQTELLGTGLIAAGRYGLYAFLGAATRLAAFLLVALALALGGGPLSAAAVMAGAECAGLLVMAGFVHHHAPWLRYGRSGVAGAVLRRLAAPLIGFAGFTAGNALGIQGPVLVIGAALDPAAVAVFSTLRLLARAAELAVFALILQRALAFLGQRPGELVGAVLRPPVEVLGWLAGTASKRAVSPLRRRATAFPGKGPGRESGRCRVRRWGSPEDKPHAPTAVFRPSSPIIPRHPRESGEKAGRKRGESGEKAGRKRGESGKKAGIQRILIEMDSRFRGACPRGSGGMMDFLGARSGFDQQFPPTLRTRSCNRDFTAISTV